MLRMICLAVADKANPGKLLEERKVFQACLRVDERLLGRLLADESSGQLFIHC